MCNLTIPPVRALAPEREKNALTSPDIVKYLSVTCRLSFEISLDK
jgi:hypothetical protein